MPTLDLAQPERMVRAYLAASLANVVGLHTLVGPSDPEPPPPWSGGRLVRLVAVDVMPRARQKPGSDMINHADAADVSIVLAVALAPASVEANVYAVPDLLAAVALALDEKTLVSPPAPSPPDTPTHTLQLGRAEYRADPPDDDQPIVRTGSVSVTGVVYRAV